MAAQAEVVRLGVISNPFSRTNARTRLADRLIPHVLGPHHVAVTTRTASELDAALRRLLLDEGVNVLGLNGGDGTLNLGVNRLLALAREREATTGEPFVLPPLLFLNGGTLNIVSRATGTKGNPAVTVRTFLERYGASRPEDLPVRPLRMLAVATEGAATRFGFVFGSEIVANALEMYTMFGEGYVGFSRFLAEVALGHGVGTRLWQEHGWKLDPTGYPIEVDGRVFETNLGVVAATIDLALAKGLFTAIQVPPNGHGFFAKVLLETHRGRTIALIPRLMLGQSDPRVRDFPDAHSLRVHGSYTLDGELFIDRSPSGSRRGVHVTIAERRVGAVAL